MWSPEAGGVFGSREASVIVCPRCGKENQDHYKFCLGCGAELPRDSAQAPKSFTAPTPPAGFPKSGGNDGVPSSGPTPAAGAPRGPSFGGAAAVGGAGAGGGMAVASTAPSAAAPAAAAPATLTCPSCSSSVPFNFKFCGSCGHPMAELQAAAMGGAAAAAPAPMPAPSSTGRGALVLIRPDGSEGESFQLADKPTPVGRDAGALFASDSYLSPQHATFRFQGADLVVEDAGSLNGVYVRVEAEVPVELADGGIFRIGQEILRYERIQSEPRSQDGVEVMGSPDPGFLGRIRLVIGRETYGNSYCIPPDGMHLGRERGDIIFPDDGYVSGLHCRIHSENGRIMLTDVGSSNGTFVRVSQPHKLKPGTMVLMGQQLFRVEY